MIFKTIRKLQIETLKEQMKPVILEKHDSENRDESISQTIVAFVFN